MFAISEQLTQATRAAIDAHIVSATAFTQAAFDSYANVIDLNVDAVKTSLAAATVAGTQLLAVKDPKELFSVGAVQSEHALERVRAYGRQAADAVQNSRAQFTRVAENEAAASKQKLIELVEVAKKAPAAGAPLHELFKPFFAQAQAGYDQAQRGLHAVASAATAPARSATLQEVDQAVDLAR